MADVPMPETGNLVHLPLSGFARSGVYFLWLKGVVVYVGQSCDMRQRIGQHLAQGETLFDAVSCSPCSNGERIERERYYITALSPKYNKCGIAKEAKGLARRGIDAKINGYSQKFAEPDMAASMLGITIDELRAVLPAEMLKPITKRVPRSNVKRRVPPRIDMALAIQLLAEARKKAA